MIVKSFRIVLFTFFLLCFVSCTDEDILNEENPTEDASGLDDDKEDTPSDDSEGVVQIEHTYPKTEGPDKNPLKGWNSGWWGSDNDYASVGFQYLKWSVFEPTNGNFDFNAVEEVINRPGTKDKHFVLRLYCDWFGENEASDAGPEWLYTEEGIARIPDGDGKHITDYNDPNFIKEAVEAIEALAEHYDNDPRIYALQIGLIGWWGEWHTSSFSGDFNIADTTRDQILDAYKRTLSNAKIMGRYPWRAPLSDTGGIGFHNDFFKPTGHSDDFDRAVNDNGKWLDGPIGGEMPPENEFDDAEVDEMFGTSRGVSMVETGHYSTMKPVFNCTDGLNATNCEGFMEMHRRMGYNYQLEKALFPEKLSPSDALQIDIEVKNIGVAPMYYDWDVQVALLSADGELVSKYDVAYDLTQVVSDDSIAVSLSENISGVTPGDYQLGIRIIQPGADDEKPAPWKLDARNTYILFSNELPTIEGTWNEGNKLIGGWSILGNVILE